MKWTKHMVKLKRVYKTNDDPYLPGGSDIWRRCHLWY
jgi:hypothetical protein